MADGIQGWLRVGMVSFLRGFCRRFVMNIHAVVAVVAAREGDGSDRPTLQTARLPGVMEQELATRIQNYLCLDAHYRPFDCSCRIGPIMPTYILYGYLL